MTPENTPQTQDVDMTAIEVFRFDGDGQKFEDFGQENGFRFWWASDLGAFLGYETFDSFRKVVNRAMAACGQLNIPCEENFNGVRRVVEGKEQLDQKLSRFACYLTAMNGDPNKPKVAQAQAYFAVMAEGFRQYLEDGENIERLNTRDEITKGEKSLGGVAKAAGVTIYPYFQNAGYRGMYNMNLSELKTYKGANPDKSLLDFMGSTELAANLFRITQTELKLKNEQIKGQANCEAAAHKVGKAVRQTMIDLSGTTPESFPLKPDINDTRKNIKKSSKEFKKLDAKKKKP